MLEPQVRIEQYLADRFAPDRRVTGQSGSNIESALALASAEPAVRRQPSSRPSAWRFSLAEPAYQAAHRSSDTPRRSPFQGADLRLWQ
jgi:hypothetical protein